MYDILRGIAKPNKVEIIKCTRVFVHSLWKLGIKDEELGSYSTLNDTLDFCDRLLPEQGPSGDLRNRRRMSGKLR